MRLSLEFASARVVSHAVVPGSFAAGDGGDADASAAGDHSKTIEVQVNRILREQKMKLGKLKKDNANLRFLLENESAAKAEVLPGMSVMTSPLML